MRGLDPDLRALQEVRDLVHRAKEAQRSIRRYTQAQTDALCEAMAQAGAAAAYDLARLAVEETGIGRVHYKVLKNLFGSEGVWQSIRGEKTVGIVSRDERAGVLEVATPVGVVAAVIPTTNPTSTALGKALIAIKGRNAIVLSPHPRSRRNIFETAEVLRRAIERAGGPPDLVVCLQHPTIESTGALMKHRDVSIILATGGSGLVRAAYSSGKPAYGVGPGNVPCYVDRSADLQAAARAIVASQSFDNATLCCSEQALVLDRPIAEPMLAALREAGAHLCDEAQTRKLEAYCNRGGMMNADVVGKDPWYIAEQAGFHVPRECALLLAHQGGVGKQHPLSIEVLCPLLSVHVVDGPEEGCKVSMEILHFGGLGHTCAVWARDERVLEDWFVEKPASRIVANGGSSQAAVGYSTNLVPSMSLGCGPQAGNITSDNITARHLVNFKRVAFPSADWPARELRDHERAAALSGDVAPRGSGLAGDPARRATSAPNERPATNWNGNPAVGAAQEAPNGPTPAPAPAGATSPAPQRAGSPAASVSAAPASFTQPRPATAAAPSRPPTHVGGALSPAEIQTMMSHAGSGCPLGPCGGCPHHDVRSGACSA